MCGALAVINDVPKTWVYRIAAWINRKIEIIPKASIEKPPSAELRPNQTDQDSLPPYDLLDRILEGYIVDNHTAEELVQRGYPEKEVRETIARVMRNEYKRRQAAPGLRVTGKAFGVGRRMPIAHRHS
jgi:NAD+ synthetase